MDNKKFLKALGRKIKILRTLKEVSQDDISNALGVDKSYLSKLERGLANPSILYLRSIANFFGMNIEELLDLNVKYI